MGLTLSFTTGRWGGCCEDAIGGNGGAVMNTVVL